MHRNANDSSGEVCIIITICPLAQVVILFSCKYFLLYSKGCFWSCFIIILHWWSCFLWNQFCDFLNSFLNISLPLTNTEIPRLIHLMLWGREIMPVAFECCNIKYKQMSAVLEDLPLWKLSLVLEAVDSFCGLCGLDEVRTLILNLQPRQVPLWTEQPLCLPVYMFTPNNRRLTTS